MDCMLFETPIHAIDTIRFLAGADVSEVHSVVQRSMSGYRDVHAALVAFENGVVAQLIHNYTTNARLERYEIHGHEISAYMEGRVAWRGFLRWREKSVERGWIGHRRTEPIFYRLCERRPPGRASRSKFG